MNKTTESPTRKGEGEKRAERDAGAKKCYDRGKRRRRRGAGGGTSTALGGEDQRPSRGRGPEWRNGRKKSFRTAVKKKNTAKGPRKEAEPRSVKDKKRVESPG